MGIIANFWFAYKIAKIKGIKLNLLSLEKINSSWKFKDGVYEIKISLINKYFKEIFLHEYGHVVGHRNKRFKLWSYEDEISANCLANIRYFYRPYASTLRDEAFASKFSRRCYKGNKDILLWAFNTYSAIGYLKLNKSNIDGQYKMYLTDLVQKYTETIRGK